MKEFGDPLETAVREKTLEFVAKLAAAPAAMPFSELPGVRVGRFSLRVDGVRLVPDAMCGFMIEVLATVPDRDPPHAPRQLKFVSPVGEGEAAVPAVLAMCVRDMLRDLLSHEVCEHVYVGSRREFDPHELRVTSVDRF